MSKKSRFQPENRGGLWYCRDSVTGKLCEAGGFKSKDVLMGMVRGLRQAERSAVFQPKPPEPDMPKITKATPVQTMEYQIARAVIAKAEGAQS